MVDTDQQRKRGEAEMVDRRNTLLKSGVKKGATGALESPPAYIQAKLCQLSSRSVTKLFGESSLAVKPG
jgi:hypothetical protein